MTAICDALDLASYIIKKFNGLGYTINNIELQKILVDMYDLFKTYNTRLFMNDIDEYFFGRYVPDVYYSYYKWGVMDIRDYSNDSVDRIDSEVSKIDKCLIERVIYNYMDDKRNKKI